jgi:signal transduction histidine kinase/ActR/RegA family two-component response regulator
VLPSTHADALTRLDHRPKPFIAALTLGILVLVMTLSIADLWSLRARTIALAERRAANLALVLSEYIREAFTAGDASLRQLAIYSSRAGGPEGPDADWGPILTSTKAALTGIGSITVTDADGTIRHSSQRTIIGESRRDDYVFKRLAALQSDELIVGTPFRSRVPPYRLIIPFGRRLVGKDGVFEGTLVATAIPEDSRGFFKTVDVGASGTVWVFHPTGVVLFREPSENNPIGETALENLIFKAADKLRKPGTLQGPIEPGGAPFISAFQPIATPPLIVALSLNRDEVLADWDHERNVTSAGLVVLGLTLTLTVFVLFRQIDGKARAEHELSQVQRREAIKLRETNERLAAALANEQRARRETEEASYVKDEFLMTVSHELRTPLTAIYGWSRLLATEQVRDEQKARALATIERNARAQARLIDDLLDVSRVISGKLRLDIRQVNLADVVRGAVDAMRPALGAKGILLETMIDPNAGPIAGDPERLQQVLWNLLSNATKFTPEGGRMQLRLEQAGSHVEMVLTDTGVGISPDFLPYVFERFRQQEGGSRRRYGGLGLGLAIVRHLIELHGGSVTAESGGEGRGATFRVVLPVQPTKEAAEQSERRRSGPTMKTAARLDGVRVLVVEDEAETRELFASILEAAGATVVTASSAADALAILGDDDQDVLVSDIEMPGQDGHDLVVKALALARDRGARLSAVAVTAYARAEDRARALEHGYQWHLAKPVDPSELVSVIASLAHAPSAPSRPH